MVWWRCCCIFGDEEPIPVPTEQGGLEAGATQQSRLTVILTQPHKDNDLRYDISSEQLQHRALLSPPLLHKAHSQGELRPRITAIPGKAARVTASPSVDFEVWSSQPSTSTSVITAPNIDQTPQGNDYWEQLQLEALQSQSPPHITCCHAVSRPKRRATPREAMMVTSPQSEICYYLLHQLRDTEDIEDVILNINLIADRNTDLVMDTIQTYLTTEKEISSRQRFYAYTLLCQYVCTDSSSILSDSLAISIVSIAYADISNEVTMEFNYQDVAATILIYLEKHFSEYVTTVLVSSFMPGVLPHRNVLLTIANLSPNNGVSRMILGELMPVMHLASDECTKSAVCQLILRCCTGAQSYFKPTINTSHIEEEATVSNICEAFEVIFYSWLGNKTSEAKQMVLKTVGDMSSVIPWRRFEDHVPYVIDGLIAQYGTELEPFYVTECISKVLGVITCNETEILACKSYCLAVGLFSQACIAADDTPLWIKHKKLIYENFVTLAKDVMDLVVEVLCRWIDTGNERKCCTAISILRHVIDHCVHKMTEHWPIILDTAVIALKTRNIQVTEGPLGFLICDIAYKGCSEDREGWKIIDYVVSHCTSSLDSSTDNNTTEENEATLQEACLTTLQCLSSCNNWTTNYLWTRLLHCVCSRDYNDVLIPFCVILTNLTLEKQKGGIPNFLMEMNNNEDLPSPQALFTSILMLSRNLDEEGKLASAALGLLLSLSPLIHRVVPPVWKVEIPVLLDHVEVFHNGRKKQWEKNLIKFIVKTLRHIKSEKWMNTMAGEVRSQLTSSSDSRSVQAFLFKLMRAITKAIPSEPDAKKNMHLIGQVSK